MNDDQLRDTHLAEITERIADAIERALAAARPRPAGGEARAPATDRSATVPLRPGPSTR